MKTALGINICPVRLCSCQLIMAARDRYSDTLREIKCVQDCIDRGLLAAIEGAQPSGIGKKLTQNGFEIIQSLEDEKLSNDELAMIIVNSVLRQIEKRPSFDQ